MIKNKNYRISKKGFAFTFLAFFISVVIFSFVALNMTNDTYTKDNVFKDARISYIDDEIKYFKNSYINGIISYSFYMSLESLTNYSRNASNYQTFEGNYTKFQDLILESILYGSFDLVNQSNMKNKTVKYFTEIFSNNFHNNYRGNFSFDILNMYVYEERPYYITAQVFASYNITTFDNISSWFFYDEFKISVPIYDLYDPEFILMDDLNVSIRPSERYLSDQNWSIDIFKQVLDNNYSLVYYEPNNKYTIGASYFSRFINFSPSSYKDVLGFWSFDYDDEKRGIFDSSLNFVNGDHYGNSKLLFSFDNDTVVSNTVYDLTSYKNDADLLGSVDCTVLGISSKGCFFDGTNYIRVNDSDSIRLGNSPFSISVWINFTNSLNGADPEVILSKEDSFILRRINDSNTNVIDFGIFNSSSSSYEPRLNSSHLRFNNTNLNPVWNNVIVMYNLSHISMYLNGVYKGNLYVGSLDISSINNLFIGSEGGISDYFSGVIDELAIYSKVLSLDEIARVYSFRKVQNIDYIDSLHTKGVEFKGGDNFVFINQSIEPLSGIENYSIELWIKPYLNSSNSFLRQGIFNLKNSSGINFRFFLNGFNQLEFDLVPGEIGNLTSNFSLNQWQYFTVTYNGSQLSLYRNSKLIDTANIGYYPMGTFENLTLSFNASANRFFGLIDEVKIYNRTLSLDEIERNYYNYKGFSKGCCNYLTLINPNIMGYNNPSYLQNVSYSSKAFYDVHKRSKPVINIALYNITNITSQDTSMDYYNLILDHCLADAYAIFNYQNATISVDLVNLPGTFKENSTDCSNLIKWGFY